MTPVKSLKGSLSRQTYLNNLIQPTHSEHVLKQYMLDRAGYLYSITLRYSTEIAHYQVVLKLLFPIFVSKSRNYCFWVFFLFSSQPITTTIWFSVRCDWPTNTAAIQPCLWCGTSSVVYLMKLVVLWWHFMQLNAIGIGITLRVLVLVRVLSFFKRYPALMQSDNLVLILRSNHC